MDRFDRGSGGAQALLARRLAARPGDGGGGEAPEDSPFGAMLGAVGGMFAVPLERLCPDPAQPRKDFDERQLEELAANMKIVGQIQPAIVRPDPEQPGHYVIVVGERRWQAAARAGLERLQCILSAEDARLVPAKQWSENHFRVDLSPIEEAGGLKAIMEVEGLDAVAAAARYGISERTIRRHLQILSAPVWIQAAVVKGEEVELADGSKEVRKLDLTGAVELQRTFNSYCRLEEAAARTSSKAARVQSDQERVPAEAGAKAQRMAEAVKARALRENWSRRRWQDFAAAAAKQGPAPVRGGAKIPRPPGRLFDSREDRLIVHVRSIEGSSAVELRRLARCLSELLERVGREADRGEVRERQRAAVAGDSAAGDGAQVHGCGHE